MSIELKDLTKSSSRHEYILVAIDYFTKWVEAASYAKLTVAMVAKFIRSHIICRYRIPHELISDREVHFGGERSSLSHYGLIALLLYLYRSNALLLVYGMKAVLPVEIEMGSLRVALE
ncbi:hypothetical protein CK203_049419 [Vitis vinifera]|uniref:Integrase catalytic domain-containing protein n=1 Tax=Vitis vinifera TaxID=29760 RepID=A0A438HAY4_VITVI|nr:hypothetical protein CK203_049419 [Vitis vinifera]